MRAFINRKFHGTLACLPALRGANPFDHADFVSAGIVDNFVHISAHESNAATTGVFEVVIGGRIRYGGRVEALALVGNDELDLFGLDGKSDGNGLIGVETIAVLYGVGEGLLEGQTNGKKTIIGIVLATELGKQTLLDLSSRGELGRNVEALEGLIAIHGQH
jgi:hypothetical protein